MAHIVKQKHEKIIILCLMLATFGLNVYFVFQSKMIYMSADEMGPIAIAAMWNGQDWSQLIRHCPYYSYGYAFLLYPLFAFFKGPVAFYRAAIVLNALLVAGVVPLAISIGKKVFPDIDIKIIYLGAFVAANCVGNISRSPSAWCEVLLMFLNWLLLWLFTVSIEKISYKNIIAAAITVVYLYTVHQRMLGVVIAYTIALAILCFMKKASIKYYVIYLMTLFLVFTGHRWIKLAVKTNLWQGGAKSNTNDYSSTIKSVFSQDIGTFIKNFVYSLSGHLFYIMVATAGLALIAIVFLVVQNGESLFKIIKRQPVKERNVVVHVYVLLCFLGILGISLLYLCKGAGVSTANRSDYLLYGRYVEPILSILIFVGIMVLNGNKILRKVNNVLVGLLVLFACLSYRRYIVIQDLDFNKMNCVGLNIFYKDGKVHYLPAVLLVVCVLVFLLLTRNQCVKIMVIGLISLYGIASGMHFVKNNVILAQDTKYELIDLIEEKERLNDDAKMYYFGEEAFIYHSSFIQYLLKDEETLYYESEGKIPNEVFYGITEDMNFLLEHDELEILNVMGNVILFSNETKKELDGLHYPIDEFGFNIDIASQQENTISSQGYEGIFMYGPYISLDEGNYKVTILYEASAVEEEWGKAEVYHFGTNQILDEVEIDNTSNEDGCIILEFELKEPMDSLEFRIHTVDGQEVVVKDVILQQIP